MKHLLAAGTIELLSEVAWSNVLLAFDFDGTLAPIVSDRDAAKMTPKTERLLARVAAAYPTAVISGRSRSDVGRRLGAARVKYVVGNHGLEPGAKLPAFEEQVDRARRALERALATEPGIEIEDKKYSLALHYRRARLKQGARDAIARAVATLDDGMRMIGGKAVVNIIPAGAPNKADALVHLRDKERADIAVYVGDDATDEDVFELDQPGRLVSIRVGASKSSSARYFLKNQSEVDEMLAKLASLRTVSLEKRGAGERSHQRNHRP